MRRDRDTIVGDRNSLKRDRNVLVSVRESPVGDRNSIAEDTKMKNVISASRLKSYPKHFGAIYAT